MRKTRYQENSNFINFSMMQSESGGKNAGLMAVDERWIASGQITNPDKFPSACRVENRDEKIIKLRFGSHKFKFHCNENRCVMNFWTNEMENEFWYLTPILYFAGGCKNTIEFFWFSDWVIALSVVIPTSTFNVDFFLFRRNFYMLTYDIFTGISSDVLTRWTRSLCARKV